ncbi:MAG TPA: 30S ribosomal protein S20 [Candidatus Angelobacter sp.]|nr:30S ribosomal protein S20 [Candidatus Angelobacter sp.]
MPNTKSAERRMRNSARKRLHNRSIKSSLHQLEKKYVALLTSGKKEDATQTLRAVSSAFDKAAKTGVIHKATADRKKSRLSARLNAVAAK